MRLATEKSCSESLAVILADLTIRDVIDLLDTVDFLAKLEADAAAERPRKGGHR